MTKDEITTGPQLSEKTRNTILDRVTASFRTITIVVGPTGCGKSTLVPVAVQDGLGGTILCTQPRRLAVVAVASRVAQMKGCRLGEAVGYHVGQSNVTHRNETKIIFATAGILLEDILANGIAALERYECILVDECHERSTESDMSLALLRLLMRSHPQAQIRIILMSATFDHRRYSEYFESVPGVDFVDVVTLETAESFSSFYDRVQTYYFDDFVKMLPDKDDHRDLVKTMRRDPNIDLRVTSTDGGKSLSAGLLRLIGSLAFMLDGEEPLSAVFLIFAPTYRHLEQIHNHLIYNWDDVKKPGSLMISVLHSSVDIEDCIRSMNQSNNGSVSKRHVLLASAIADSSITIPGVTCVIDTCRSLEVSWGGKTHNAKTVWSSRAICDQRRGRTGRTCAGRVFRCIPKGFYLSSLQEFETPQLTLSECRDESMALLSSTSNEINRFNAILGQTLDPPPEPIIQQAAKYLIGVDACFETGGQRSRIVATEYGRLMSTLPFSISNARAILTAAQYGFVHEMLLFKSIQTIRPTPIINYFADELKSTIAMINFMPSVDSKDPVSVALAQMAAYMYWDVHWNKLRRQAAYMAYQDLTNGQTKPNGHSKNDPVAILASILKQTCNKRRRDFGVWSWAPEVEEVHFVWCKEHEINPTSVRAIAETVDITMKIVYLARFEPPWLRCCKAEPLWQRVRDWPESDSSDAIAKKDMLEFVYAESRCADPLRTKIENIISNPTAMASGPEGSATISMAPQKEACVHFLNGNCTFGDRCRNSHSVLAKRPVCRFYLAGSCTKGDSCVYAHGNANQLSISLTTKKGKKKLVDPFTPFAPPLPHMTLLETKGPRSWYQKHGSGLVLFGESNFAFSLALASMGISPALMTNLEEVDTSSLRFNKLDKSRIFGGIDATKIHMYNHLFTAQVAKCITSFAWNFPYTGADEDPDDHEDLLLATMISMGLLSKKLGLINPQFGVSLQGDQFSRWSMQRIANQAGWHLISFCKFEHKDFGNYRPCRSNGDPFPFEHARFYVFQWWNDDVAV